MSTKSLKDVKESFTQYLQRKHLEYCNKIGRTVTQNEFAVSLGIQGATFSQWVTQNRTPQIKQLKLLQQAWGYEIFDILELPWLIPDDPSLHRVVEKWNNLPEEIRKNIQKTVDEFNESERSKRPLGETVK